MLDDDDVAADSGRGRGRVIRAWLVVVDHGVRRRVPDLDAAPVHPATTARLIIVGHQQDGVVPLPNEPAYTLELHLQAGDDQPVVVGADKAEVCHVALEVGAAGQDRRRLLILGDEPEAGLDGQGRGGSVAAGRPDAGPASA